MQIGDKREYPSLGKCCFKLTFQQIHRWENSLTIPLMWLCFEICGSDIEMQKGHLLYFQSPPFPLEVYWMTLTLGCVPLRCHLDQDQWSKITQMIIDRNWTDESLSREDSPIHLIYHDRRSLGSLILIRIIPKECTLSFLVSYMVLMLFQKNE